jgi:hypothetical protein
LFFKDFTSPMPVPAALSLATRFPDSPLSLNVTPQSTVLKKLMALKLDV